MKTKYKSYDVESIRKHLNDVINGRGTMSEKIQILSANGVSIDPDDPPMYFHEKGMATGFYMDGKILREETVPVTEVDESFLAFI